LLQVKWVARLRRLSKGVKGDDGVSNRHGSGSDAGKHLDDDGFEMPEPTYAFGAIGPFEPTGHPSVPSRAEIEDRPLLEAAMAIKDPWADTEAPPLYSRRVAGS
jgi:hypothetical protein